MLQVLYQAFQVALYAWLMATHPQKAELRYGIPTSGTQFVMIPGKVQMQLWYAGNLGTKEQPLLIRGHILAEDQEGSY